MPKAASKVTKSHYETLAALRRGLRTFLHFSEAAAQAAGLTAQQHQAMLAIKGGAGDRDHASVGEIAERLHLRHHSAVGLVDRLETRQLVRRAPSSADRRRVDIHLTPKGEALLEKLSAAHLAELRQHGPELHRLLGEVMGR